MGNLESSFFSRESLGELGWGLILLRREAWPEKTAMVAGTLKQM